MTADEQGKSARDRVSVSPRRSRGQEPAPSGAASLIDSLILDLRFALRVLGRSPVFSVVTILVLAIGIGANTTIFSLANEILLRPLPINDPDRVVDVFPEIPGGNSFGGFAYLDYRDYAERNQVLEELAAFRGIQVPLGERTDTDEVSVQLISSNFFRVLGVSAAQGQLSLPAVQDGAGDRVGIISHAFWQRQLGGDPGAIGSDIRINGELLTVVGITPPGFTGTFIGFPMEIWAPLTAAAALDPQFDLQDRADKGLEMIGRLREGATVAMARTELNRVAEGIEEEHPILNRGHRVGVVTTTGLDHSLRRGVVGFLAILSAVAGIILLVACLNVGGILLARAMTRQREMSIRMAMGAAGGRLVRQLLTEALVLFLGGALLAILLSLYLTDLIRGFLSTVGGLGLALVIDWRVLSMTAVASLLAALVAGLAPAFHVARGNPAGVLRAQGGSRGPRGASLRASLVVGQVFLSVMLVSVTGLFVRSLGNGLTLDPGFDADRVAEFTITLPEDSYDEAEGRLFQANVLERVRRLPSVEAAALAAVGPIGVARTPVGIRIAGHQPPPGASELTVDHRVVGPGYFNALGLPLLSGSDLSLAEMGADQLDGVVSRAFADRFWPGGEVVGELIQVRDQDVRIVGVAADSRYLIQDRTPDPLLYLPTGQRYAPQVQVLLRVSGDPAQLISPIEELVAELDPNLPPANVRTTRDLLSRSVLPQRVAAFAIGAMGLTALLLTGIGLFGLIQYTVSRDFRELGIRMALGGSAYDVLGIILRRGVMFVAVGVGLGILATLLLAPTLRGFLIGVSPFDPATYGAVIGTFAFVAVIASYLPARRASRIEPAVALRMD